MAAFNGWATSLLRSLGAPVTKENLRFLDAWQRAEGGSAAYNPLNTTQPFGRSTAYNHLSGGGSVKNYETPHAGILATKQTLLNGHYNVIVNLLKSGHASAGQMATAVANSPWGTGGGVLRVLGENPQPLPATRGGIMEPPKTPQPSITGALDNWKQMIASQFMGNAAQLAAGQMPNMGGILQLAQMRAALQQSQPPVSPQGHGHQYSGKYGQAIAAGHMDYPASRIGKIIGTPYAGTHTLGNWESDNAIDIALPQGTPIIAPADGVIGSQIGSLGQGGRFAGLRAHLVTKGNEFYFAHLSRLNVQAGEHVRKGQIIGWSGSANGVQHLHLGVAHGNPLSMFGGK